ncbi:hypothetical protein [Bradyrhizobium sp. JYMT SZCCT0428]|uniref:hypothetical protein n=1 Tax=Bradyrhizobium sp. JYMT SZCCT0428 TaxID=2807673 RepID=UPI001BAACA11|nr:hypothetical protein [Bradyrhizobium sp. JYMT SZCCT0428]MBR1156581.1 hypothetical protein [Bradyrhizobium sp. JYMT SZCCT0428]
MMNTPTAGEKFGILGRRTIRKPAPGQPATSGHVGLWDLAPKAGSTAHRLQQIYVSALSSVDAIEARKAEAARSGKFTPDGLKADALQFAAQQLSPVFHRGKHQIAAAKREAAELRSLIKLQPADRTDLVAAMLRAEMRDFLRSKPQAARDAFIAENLETIEPEMALAFSEVPPQISGISTVQRDALIERAMEAQHGEVLREVKELEAALVLAERAVELGREEIIKEVGTDPQQFNELAAPYESRAGVAWLRKSGDKVIVVDLDRKVNRQPTQQELETGAYFADFAEYAMANGLPADDRSAAA